MDRKPLPEGAVEKYGSRILIPLDVEGSLSGWRTMCVLLYEGPDVGTDLPEWIRECHPGVNRIAGRLRDNYIMTLADARNYFEGAAAMLAVSLEQIRQWKHPQQTASSIKNRSRHPEPYHPAPVYSAHS